MILNALTIVALGTALLTGLLAAPIAGESLRLYRRRESFTAGAAGDAWERRASLLLLLSVVVFLVKLPSWPFFYASLYSYVPHVPGAMCVFGVTQVKPLLSFTMQILKPLVFFFSGMWLIVHNLERNGAALPFAGKKPLVLAAVSLLAVADSLLDIVFYATFDTKTEIACCTTVFDLSAPGTERLAASIGFASNGPLLAGYYGVNVLLILLLGRSYRTNGLTSTAAAALATIVSAVISVYAWRLVLAPKLMELPGHHCIYCMWQYAPSSMAMTGLFVLGIASSGWAAMLKFAGAREASPELAAAKAGFWRRIALVSLSGSLVLASL